MKKNIDINLYGAKEMTQQEMISTEGGDLVVVPVGGINLS